MREGIAQKLKRKSCRTKVARTRTLSHVVWRKCVVPVSQVTPIEPSKMSVNRFSVEAETVFKCKLEKLFGNTWLPKVALN